MLKIILRLYGASLGFCFLQSNHLKSMIFGGDISEQRTFCGVDLCQFAQPSSSGGTFRLFPFSAINNATMGILSTQSFSHVSVIPAGGRPRCGMRGPKDMDLCKQ